VNDPSKEQQFKHLGRVVADQNFMHEGIKSRLSLGDACSHSVGNLRLKRQVII
jgi:hypothetical protein